MTKKIEDGGPAFPHPGGANDVTVQTSHLGLSLRDWFAASALPAIIEHCVADYRPSHERLSDYFARKAYEVADAMLIARKGGET